MNPTKHIERISTTHTNSVEKKLKKTTLTESPTDVTPTTPQGLHVLDKTRNYLSTQLHLTTPAGILHPHLRSVPIAAFTPEQVANLDSYYEKKFALHNDKFNINFNALISGEELVADLIAQCAKGIPVPKIGNVKLAFKSFETAGSVTKKAITIPYLENLTRNLITYSSELNQVYLEPETIDQHIQNIFTAELKQHLAYRLKLPIPDGDYRLHLSMEFIPTQAGLILKGLQEVLIDIVAKRVPKITDISLKERIIAVINEQYSHENLKWLTVDYPDFERVAIKYLGFSKMALINDIDNQFLIVAIGDNQGHRIEITLINKIRHTELAPSIAIPSDKQLKEKPTPYLFPLGSNRVQFFINLILGIINPTSLPYDENFLRALICGYTKQLTCPLVGVEDAETRRTLEVSLLKNHYIVKKLVKRGISLDNLPSFFISYVMNNAISNHLFSDPNAAIACTFNTLVVFENKLRLQDITNIIHQMKKHLEITHNDLDKITPLQAIGHILSDDSILLEQKLAFIKLCLFAYAQVEQPSSPTTFSVVIRENKQKPFCIASFPVSEEVSYSLMAETGNLLALLSLVQSFLQKPHDEKMKTCITLVIKQFYPQFNGHASSAALNFKAAFNIKEKDVLQKICDLIEGVQAEESLFGSLMFFAFQTLSENIYNQHMVTSHLPKLTCRFPSLTGTIIDNYEKINKSKMSLKLYNNDSSTNEVKLIEQLFLSLYTQPDTFEYSVKIWETQLLTNPDISWAVKTTHAERLIQQARTFNPSLGLKILLSYMKKNLLSLEGEVDLFNKLLTAWSSSKDKLSDLQTVEIIFDSLQVLDLLGIRSDFVTKMVILVQKIPSDILSASKSLEKAKNKFLDLEKKNLNRQNLVKAIEVTKNQTQTTPSPAPPKNPEIKKPAAKIKPTPQPVAVTPAPTKPQDPDEYQKKEIADKINTIEVKITKNSSQAIKDIENLLLIYSKLTQQQFIGICSTLIDHCIQKKDLACILSLLNNKEIQLRLSNRFKNEYRDFVFQTLDFAFQHPGKIDANVFSVFHKLIMEIDNNSINTFSDDNLLVIIDNIYKFTKIMSQFSFSIPQNFIQTSLQKALYFLSAAKDRDSGIHAAKFYISLKKFGDNLIDQHAKIIIEILLENCDKKLSPHEWDLFYQVVADLPVTHSKVEHSPTRSLIEKLLLSAQTFKKVDICLNLLTNTFTFASIDDFELLLSLITKFQGEMTLDVKCRYLLYFSGHLRKPSETLVVGYLSILKESFENNLWSLGCQIISKNIIDPSHEDIKSLFSTHLKTFLGGYLDSEHVISEEMLLVVIDLIKIYYPQDTELWSKIILIIKKKYSQKIHEILLQWFNAKFSPDIKPTRTKDSVLSTLWFDLILLLKQSPNKSILVHLSQYTFIIDACQNLFNNQQKEEIYTLLWKLWSDAIANQNPQEKQKNISHLYHFAVACMNIMASTLTEEKALDKHLSHLQLLLNSKNEKDFDLFTQQFRHHVKSIKTTLTLSLITQEQLKKFFLQVASVQWENKAIKESIVESFFILISKANLPTSFKLKLIPLALCTNVSKHKGAILSFIKDFIDSKAPISREELGEYGNNSVGEFLFAIAQNFRLTEKLGINSDYLDTITDEIKQITYILIASKTTLLAKMDILDKTAARVLMSLEKFSNSTLRSRIELTLYRPKSIECIPLLENPQAMVYTNPETLINELFPLITYYMRCISQDFHFLKTSLEQAGKTVYKKTTNRLLGNILDKFTYHYLILDQMSPGEKEIAKVAILTINKVITNLSTHKPDEIVESINFVRTYVAAFCQSSIPEVKNSVIELTKHLKNSPNATLDTISYIPELVDVINERKLTPQYLANFLKCDTHSRLKALEYMAYISVSICQRNEHMHIVLKYIILNGIGELCKRNTDSAINFISCLLNPAYSIETTEQGHHTKLIKDINDIYSALALSDASFDNKFIVIKHVMDRGIQYLTALYKLAEIQNVDSTATALQHLVMGKHTLDLKISIIFYTMESLETKFSKDTQSFINKIKCLQEIVFEPLAALYDSALAELGFIQDDHYIPIDIEPNGIEILTDAYCEMLLTHQKSLMHLNIEFKANTFYQLTKMIDSYYRHRKLIPSVEKSYIEHAIHLCCELTKNEPTGTTYFNIRFNVKQLIERLKKIPRHNEHHYQLHTKYMALFTEKTNCS